MRVEIHVPATTSNLGPGFDAIGMALDLYSTFTVETGVEATEVVIQGYGQDLLPRDESHLLLQVTAQALDKLGLTMPPVRLTQHNRVPLGSGLGSSSTAVVGGLALAQALAGVPFDREALLNDACALEGHPDNAAPCVMGGLVTALWDGAHCSWLHLPFSAQLGAVVCTPALSLSTKEMRRALPEQVPFEDAVFNGAHACMLVGALTTGRLDLLKGAVRDRLHASYRSAFIPGYDAVVRAAEAAGALVATISGAGPTIIALTDRSKDDDVAAAMEAAFSVAGLASTARIVSPRSQGTEVLIHG